MTIVRLKFILQVKFLKYCWLSLIPYYSVGFIDQHDSVFTHLLSQVKLGMDFTKFALPTFTLGRYILLATSSRIHISLLGTKFDFIYFLRHVRQMFMCVFLKDCGFYRSSPSNGTNRLAVSIRFTCRT